MRNDRHFNNKRLLWDEGEWPSEPRTMVRSELGKVTMEDLKQLLESPNMTSIAIVNGDERRGLRLVKQGNTIHIYVDEYV